ncbi:hypothetical protein [Stenoxybacter acetivorans]|uniref:hypothetical protein n=1 Tax=Stenoxybacter acetivorans TaxID=422441 RepID=UPI000565B88B|nr:hypothetical protein [Stenoxybacter acetivorans]
MKQKWTVLLSAAALATVAFSANARDTQLMLPIADALGSEQAKEVLNPKITLQFGGGSGSVLAADLVSNKKTNSFGKSDEEACQWAFLSAVKQFQQRAESLGGSRVVNLVSYYKKSEIPDSNKVYECHVGAVVAGVTLKGTIVR